MQPSSPDRVLGSTGHGSHLGFRGRESRCSCRAGSEVDEFWEKGSIDDCWAQCICMDALDGQCIGAVPQSRLPSSFRAGEGVAVDGRDVGMDVDKRPLDSV